jgi:propionyl-CoA carboxylase alpha chain
MIAKLITFGSTREESIKHMSSALDEFLIEGVANNIGFLASIMSNDRFLDGRINTDFIAEEYPEGFCAHDLTPVNPNLLICVAAAVHQAYEERASMISGQFQAKKKPMSSEGWIVQLRDLIYLVKVDITDSGYNITHDGNESFLESGWKLGEALFQGHFDGQEFCLQVKSVGIGYCLTHRGSKNDVLVLSSRAAQLKAPVSRKKLTDLSMFLLSPMPGMLVSVAVSIGQSIKAGDELAVVEAMKMENVIRAEFDCIVSTIKSFPGDILAVDQIILEFENGKI